VDPVMAYTCPIQVPDGTNDFEVVGGMRGAALDLVRCKTIDVEVPARAELVFELEVDFTKEAFEGPLGEFTGYYTPGSEKPIARIKAITHRNNAYFQALLTGVPPTENHILKQLPYEASYFAMLKAQHPTLTSVALPASGGVAFYIVVAMKQRYAGEARHAILTAIASSQRPKLVVVLRISTFATRTRLSGQLHSAANQPATSSSLMVYQEALLIRPSAGRSR